LFTAPINSTLYSRSLWLCFFSRGLCTERVFFQHPLATSMHAMYTKENSCGKCVNISLNMKQVCQVIAPTTLGLLSCQTNLFLITSHPIIGERHLACCWHCLCFIQPTHFRKLKRLITFYQDSQGTTRVSYVYLLAFVEMFGINSRTQGSTKCASPPHTSPL
jgi:hypothetical protein